MASTLTLRLPDNLDKALQKLCRMEGLSKSDIARAALERYMRVRRFEQARAVAVPLANAQGIFTDEDVFAHLVEK